MSSDRTVSVDVIRFCHRLTVEGKCHHERDGGIEPERDGGIEPERDGGIEPERTEEVDGAKSGGDGQDDWREASGVLGLSLRQVRRFLTAYREGFTCNRACLAQL